MVGRSKINNTTLSSKKNTLEKTLNHKKSGRKETTFKTGRETGREKALPNKSTVMRIRSHKINLHFIAKQIS